MTVRGESDVHRPRQIRRNGKAFVGLLPQDIGFVPAFFMLPRENKRSLGELDRAIRPRTCPAVPGQVPPEEAEQAPPNTDPA